MSDAQCPTEDEPLAFVNGSLAAEQLDLLAEHLEQCATCQSAIDSLDDVTNSLVEQLQAAALAPEDRLPVACARMNQHHLQSQRF